MDCFLQLLLLPVLPSSSLIILSVMVVMMTFARNKCFGLVGIDQGGLEGNTRIVVGARSYMVKVGSPLDCLNLENWTHRLSRNVSIQLQVYAV